MDEHGVYRRYGDQLLVYARTLLHDERAAGDALHDAFRAAGQRIGELDGPGLYAIVREACRRRRPARDLPPEPIDEPASADGGPGRPVGAAHVRKLVHAAADTLKPGDREVVHLAVQHGLSAPMLATVLGIDAKQAQVRLSRARGRLERAIGVLLVARGGEQRCDALATLIDGWGGRFTRTVRERVARHVDGCATCAELQSERLSPAALLAGYTPVFPEADDGMTTAELGGTVYNVGAFRPVFARDERRRRMLVLSGAAAVLLLMLGAVFWAFGSSEAPDRTVAAPGRPPVVPVETVAATSAMAAPVIASPAGSVRATRSAPASPAAAAPVPSGPPPSTSPAPSRAAALAESFNVTAFVTTRCDGASWSQLVSATSSADLTAATVTWTGPDGVSRSQPMLVSGQYAAAEVRGLQVDTATWVVRATAADGRGGASDSGMVARPC